MKKAYRLKLKFLSFLSSVDQPAQGDGAKALLLKRSGDEEEIEFTAKVAKTNDELGLVFGYAFASSMDGGETPHVDSQDDAIDPDFLKVAAEFMQNGGATDVNHDFQQDGKIVFAWPLEPSINEAMGIKSDVVGLAVAVKPSPETYQRFKSGELQGFSIAGTGERTPIADAAAEKALKEHIAKLEAQAEKVRKEAAENERIVQNSLTWLDDFAKEHGDEAATKIAEANKGSIGNWGEVWLAKRAEAAEKAEPVELTIEKAAEFHKAAAAAVEKALGAYNEGLATFAKAVNKTESKASDAFLSSEKGRELYKRYDEARHRMFSGLAEKAVKPFDAKIAQLTKSTDAQVEAFAIQHNIDTVKAMDRLLAVSPTFKSQYGELRQAHNEKLNAHATAMTLSQNAIAAAHQAAQKAARDEDAAARDKAADARRTPAERRLNAHLAGLAKSRGKGLPEATDWAMRNDEMAQTLYQLANEEKFSRGH